MTTSAMPYNARVRADYLNLMLWTFQGWIAMFFVAAGYAKLTESIENLTVLMQWPALVSPALVRGLGVAEILLALMVLSPLISWKLGRPLLMMATSLLLAQEVIMLLLHAMDLNIGLALTNLFLLLITAPVFWFRRDHA